MAIGRALLIPSQHESLVGKVHQHLEVLVESDPDDADRAGHLHVAINVRGLDAEGNVHRLAANFDWEREQINGVLPLLRVEILDCAAGSAGSCDGFGEVVRDAGACIEDQVAAHSVDDGAEHNALWQARNREFRNGVHRVDLVALVRDDNDRLLVVEQHLALGEVFQATKLVDGRVHVAAGVIEVKFPHELGLLVLVVDDERAARINQDALVVVVDDEVALDKVGVEDTYHEKILWRWNIPLIYRKKCGFCKRKWEKVK